MKGPCSVDAAGCIMSRNYEGSNKYRDREECEFDVKDEPSMEVLDFQVEGYEYDYLEVNGEKYSGDNTPHGKVPKGKIEWSSDYSVTHYGWKICPKPVPAPAPDAEKYTTKDCLCKHGWRYWGVDVEGHCGNPDNDPNGDWCRVEDRGCQGIGGATAKSGSDLLTMRVLGWTKEKRMLQLTLSEASGSRSLASSQVEHRGPPLAVQGSRWPAANLYQQVMLGYVRYKPKLSYCSSSSGYHCYKYRLKF